MAIACLPRFDSKTLEPFTVIDACGLEGFSELPFEHTLQEAEETVRLHTLRGQVRSRAGEWPSDHEILFEVRKLKSSQEALRIRVAANGEFEVRDLDNGTYCYKAAGLGWQSLVGIVVVTPDASREVGLDIVLDLGI